MLTHSKLLSTLPTETWIQILNEHVLSYADLKRVSRVSKGMGAFIQSSALDVPLFRGGVPAVTLAAGTQVILHPFLEHGSDFIKPSKKSFTLSHPSTTDSRTWTICELDCIEEYATSPPVTELQVSGMKRQGHSNKIKRAGGLRVIDLLDWIAKRWDQQPDHSPGEECGCGAPSYYDIYLNNMSQFTWKGWKTLQVEEGVVVLRRRWS